MQEKLTEQLPVRLTAAQREYLRDQAAEMKKLVTPSRVTEGDILRGLINRAMQAEATK